jgi:hypothetical protein
MKLTKKPNPTSPRLRRTSSFIALLLLAATFNAYSMEQPDDNTKKGWEAQVGSVLLKGKKKLKQFLSYVHSEEEQITAQATEQSLFINLPQDMQNIIIGLLAENSSAKSLAFAARTINSLTLVNHYLHDFINEPTFCLQLIKHLAQQFNCSDETAAQALQTQEAKKRLTIQREFKTLFLTKNIFDEKEFNRLYEKYKNHVDLNFTYKPLKYTLLLSHSMTPNDVKVKTTKIKCLLSTKKVDVNCTNQFGETPLIACVLNAEAQTVELLCKYPTIKINQKNADGQTALMFLCKNFDDIEFNLEKITILLENGADPEIPNNEGITPLQEIQIHQNQKSINLIQDAIHKKHGKK